MLCYSFFRFQIVDQSDELLIKDCAVGVFTVSFDAI